MNKTLIGIIYVIIMIAVIVLVDFTFLRDQPDLRLIVNVVMVAAFGALYLLVIRRLGS